MPDHQINESSIIRVQKSEYPVKSGKFYLDVRRFYWASEGDPGWRPTRKGISIPYALAPKILKLMEGVLKEDANSSSDNATDQ